MTNKEYIINAESLSGFLNASKIAYNASDKDETNYSAGYDNGALYVLDKLIEYVESEKQIKEIPAIPNYCELILPDNSMLTAKAQPDEEYPSIFISLEDNDHEETIAVIEYDTTKEREDERLRTRVYCASHDEPVYLKPYKENQPDYELGLN